MSDSGYVSVLKHPVKKRMISSHILFKKFNHVYMRSTFSSGRLGLTKLTGQYMSELARATLKQVGIK